MYKKERLRIHKKIIADIEYLIDDRKERDYISEEDWAIESYKEAIDKIKEIEEIGYE